MAELVPWNIDYEVWPGPDFQLTPWELYIENLKNITKSFSDFGEKIKVSLHTSSTSKQTAVYPKLPPMPALNRNHGPRQSMTFDRKGKRTY